MRRAPSRASIPPITCGGLPVKKLLLAAAAAVLLTTGAGAAIAAPGPNGNNDHGLCTAYFNGQKNGHDKGSPKPFAALEAVADDGDDDTSVAQDVYNYCQAAGIGGNPGQNGRYPSCFDDGDCDN